MIGSILSRDCHQAIGRNSDNNFNSDQVSLLESYPHDYQKIRAVKVEGYCNAGGSSSGADMVFKAEEETENLTELQSLSELRTSDGYSSSLDMTMRKGDIDVHGYPFSKCSGIPDLNFYSDTSTSTVDSEPSSIIDSTDSMFDDAFSLDEFLSIQQNDQQKSDRKVSHQNIPTNHLNGYGSYDVTRLNRHSECLEENQEYPYNVLNSEDLGTNQAVMNMVKATDHPSFQEIRSRTFSDLLHGEIAVYGGDDIQQKCLFSQDNDRTRDYSVSSDSGIGSSILNDTSNSPLSTGNVTEGGSTPLPISSSHSSYEYKTYEPNPKQGFPDHINSSDYSQKSSGILNDDKILGGYPPSTEDISPHVGEKISSKKTAYNEKWGVKVLKAWCLEMNIPEEFEDLSPEEFNDLLCRFWSEVRKSNGDYYGRNSLFNLRAMINKHLKGKPFCVSFDIVTDERFRSSNDMLEKQLKMLKGIGKTITHKQPISIEDLRKMYDSKVLGTNNPLSLLRKVWFEITLHFCHKGSEPQEKLLRTSFQVCRDHNYRAYICRSASTKSVNETDEIRMYETGGELCPVLSFQMYLGKLHPLQVRLFQQPRRKSTASSPMWYGKAPIGEKALQQMMANISVAAKLSKRYTNHCVRTTAVEQFSNSRRRPGGKANESIAKQDATLQELKREYERNFAAAQTQHHFSNPCHMQHIVPQNHYNGNFGSSTVASDPAVDYIIPPSPILTSNPRNVRAQSLKRSMSNAFSDTNQQLPTSFSDQPISKRSRLDNSQLIMNPEEQIAKIACHYNQPPEYSYTNFCNTESCSVVEGPTNSIGHGCNANQQMIDMVNSVPCASESINVITPAQRVPQKLMHSNYGTM